MGATTYYHHTVDDSQGTRYKVSGTDTAIGNKRTDLNDISVATLKPYKLQTVPSEDFLHTNFDQKEVDESATAVSLLMKDNKALKRYRNEFASMNSSSPS